MNTARALLLIFTLFFAQSAWSACSLTVKSVQESIDKQGANATLEELFSDEGTNWQAFMDCIQTADKNWLNIAVEMAPYRDGAVAEDLDLALGRALAVNAESVLKIAIPAYHYDMFCAMADVDGPPGNEAYLKELDARERGLAKVKDTSLLTTAQLCREIIEQARDELKTYTRG